MKVVALCVLLLAATASALSDAELLPTGFANANEVAQVLANEPASASQSVSSAVSGSGSVAFSTAGVSGGDEDKSEEDAEFDAQIEQIETDQKNLKESLREAEAAADKVGELKAEIRNLEEQKNHLQKEKEKKKLEVKLETQMKDLSEINRMSRMLRQKFAQLKQTQKLIRSKMTGTRSSINQLDAETELATSDVVDASATIGDELEAMHKAQSALLAKSHEKATQTVKDHVKTANRVHMQTQDEIEKEGEIY
eukprot:TRINITY_DN3879_c0_g1_i1.p1 TRINITY_DN3879_c0_g1~~TRINITY_DN3879_c0_g1_i1.p1  ORF type:complete len:253 (-),score=75.73 TRINITY_DN3879_c0_g1_i1:170-928(-)